MKSWLFLISFGFVLQIRAQISVYDCGAISQIVTQSEIEAADNEYYKQCIMFIPPETYEFNGNLNRKVTAATNIHLEEGVHIGPFTQDGQFWLQINPKSDFDVALMNYENLNNVLKFEKLELGVTLPQDVLTKVNNFVNEVSVPNEDKINPYLDWELRVYAEFTPAVAEWPFVIDGFYTKEFEVEMPETLPIPNNLDAYSDEEYAAIGNWEEITSDYPFRIRFAPNQIGLWTGKVKIEVNGELIHTSVPFNFNVIESGNVGYVKVGINKRYLRREGTFFPVGCNLNWPETTEANDPLLADYLTNAGAFAPEGYRIYPCMPRVYDKYKDMMTLLSNGGGNYFRWIMYPVSTDIEWEKIGDYTDRLNMAQEMDEIVEHAKELDLYIHWNMQIHFSLQFSANTYDRRWSWDSEFNNSQYCYRTLINSNNPMDFFTNETAKQYYKQRLRYILARWGYSTNVAVWELFSEISNVGAPEADNNDYYLQGNNWMIYRDWQVEMAEYLKSMYHGQCHLVTASYGGEKHPDDDTFESPFMDIMTSNIYDYNAPDFAAFYHNNVSNDLLNDIPGGYSYLNTKPLIFSETDPINLPCDDSKIEIRRSIYQSAFSGLAGALSWDLQLHPQYFSIFQPISQFVSNLDLDYGKWHPGSSTLSGENLWLYNFENAKFMDGVVDDEIFDSVRVKRADLSYLRSGDRNFCIGIITNKTYNSKSINQCSASGWSLNYGTWLSIPETVLTKNEDLFFKELSGNNMQKYYVDYYLLSDLSNPIFTKSFRLNKPQVKIPLSYDETNYQLFFVVRRKNYNLSLEQIDFLQRDEIPDEKVSFLQLEDETTISPNPVTESDLHLTISSSQSILSLKIYNVLGQLVLEKKMFSNQLDVESLSNGVYIVKIHYTDGHITSHSLSIQK